MPARTENPRIGGRFRDAFLYAAELHHHQVRKGGDIPYLTHLMAVAGIVLEHGGDEDEAIAALLHDAAEDQGGEPVLAAIGLRFGEKVKAIVLGCSDSLAVDDAQKPPWPERKQRYLEHFHGADASVRLVSMADKLHNCRTTVADLRVVGARAWDRFNAGRDQQLWFYRAFVTAASAFGRTRLVVELEAAVAELEALA